MNIKMKKRNQLWEKLFTMQIEGESFIQSPTDNWNSISVPKWRKIVASIYSDWLENKIDLQGIYNLLIKSGITFDQSYMLSIVPIEKFLQAIEKNNRNKFRKKEINSRNFEWYSVRYEYVIVEIARIVNDYPKKELERIF